MASYTPVDTSNFIDMIVRISELDLEKLARTEALGRGLSFEPAVEYFQRMKSLVSKIDTDQLFILPEEERLAVRDEIAAIYSLYVRTMRFTPHVEKPAELRMALIDEAANLSFRVHQQLAWLVDYIARPQPSLEEFVANAQLIQDEMVEKQAAQEKALASIRYEANVALSEVRGVAAEQGVSQQASHFSEAADGHARSAGRWLGVTVVLAFLLMVGSIGSLHVADLVGLGDSPYEIAQLALAKLLFFSTLAFLLLLAGRTYTAHRHNVVINRHRQHAMQTLNVFVDGASDAVTRDAVLLSVASCAFAQQDSGFIKGGSNSPMLEIAPRINGGSPSM